MQEGDSRRVCVAGALSYQTSGPVAAQNYFPPTPPTSHDNAISRNDDYYAHESRDEYAALKRRIEALEAGLARDDHAMSNIKEIEIQTKPNHKFGGRMFFDNIMMDDMAGPGGAVDAQDNFTGFDTIRIGVTGNIFENLKYSVEFEFEGGETDYKDIYAEFQELPWVGHVRVGHFKEPFGLEELVSSRYDTFMEQTVATANHAPTRNMGLMMYDYVGDNENLSWFAGVFRGSSLDNAQGRGGAGGGLGDVNDVAATGRVVWLPYYDETTPGRCLFHVELGVSTRRVGENDDVGGNGQLEGFLELDSRDGPIDAFLPAFTEFNIYGTELAWMRGPLHIANEFFYLDANNGANNWATYIEAGYFLSGENRGYSRSSKAFGRVKPYENFFAVRTASGVCRGWGAWQDVGRVSYSDLTDTALSGDLGEQTNYTAGLNWHLNPYSRVMFNYVHAESDVTRGGTLGCSRAITSVCVSRSTGKPVAGVKG